MWYRDQLFPQMVNHHFKPEKIFISSSEGVETFQYSEYVVSF